MNYCEIITTIFTGSITTILGALLGYFFSERSTRKKEIRDANNNLKDAFLDELIKFERSVIEIEGTKVYSVLINVYGKHSAAVYRFRSNLARKELDAFDVAWQHYQYPDNHTDNGVFGYYITPDENGKVKMIEPKFVSLKIESLISFTKP
jgi:hypothetical protein